MLNEWALRWGIPYAAMQDLRQRFGALDPYTPTAVPGRSEGAVSNLVRVEASKKGKWLLRNNVGVLPDETGRPVRYGLANDTPAINKIVKSADLIGIEPVLITPDMVGGTLGRFLSVEVKAEGWRFTGTPREQAQEAWAMRINALGGRAIFANREGLL